jgi:hypothetical protein
MCLQQQLEDTRKSHLGLNCIHTTGWHYNRHYLLLNTSASCDQAARLCTIHCLYYSAQRTCVPQCCAHIVRQCTLARPITAGSTAADATALQPVPGQSIFEAPALC